MINMLVKMGAFLSFDNLRKSKSKEESERPVKKSKLLSDLTEGKQDARLIPVKLNPSLGHITDDEGHVQVGGREFDVLNEDRRARTDEDDARTSA